MEYGSKAQLTFQTVGSNILDNEYFGAHLRVEEDAMKAEGNSGEIRRFDMFRQAMWRKDGGRCLVYPVEL